MNALLLTLSLLALLGGAVGVGVLYAGVRSRRSAPTLRDGLRMPAPEGGWPRVCVVTPAHNEERNIGPMARSLLAQDYPALRLVFALDRCTDGTERVLRGVAGDDARVEVVTISQCPEAWAGKTHAAWRGVQDSRGAQDAEMLLFTDADTEHEPGCVRAAVAIAHARGLDLLSALSTLRFSKWFEMTAQAPCSMELMRHHPLYRVNREENPRAFANGQFMLFRREAYDAMGGHGRVHGALLEDVALARRMRKEERRAGVVMADGVMRCRMYESFAAFVRGWKRIFTESADRRVRVLMGWAGVVAVGAGALPAAAVAALALGLSGGAIDAAGWASIVAVVCGALGVVLLLAGWVSAYRSQRAPVWSVVLAPIGAVITAWILWEAARDLRRGKGTTWGGRVYQRTAQ